MEPSQETSSSLIVTVTRDQPSCVGHACLSRGQIMGFLVCDFVIALVILAGNALVILSVVRTPSLQSKNNIFLTSLAVVDFLMAAICIPLDIVVALGFKANVQSWGCLSLSALIAMLMFLTIFHITVVAFDRFLAITSPFSYHQTMTSCRVAGLIAFIWIVTLSTCFVSFFWNNIDEYHDRNCDLLYIHGKGYRILMVVLVVVVPFSCMSYFYFRIYQVARGHRRRIAALERVLETKTFERGKYSSNIKRDLKAAVTLILVFGLFIFGWTPASFMTIIDVVIPDINLDAMYIYELVCFKIAFSNSAINPMIYAARNSEFRRAFIRQIAFLFRCKCLLKATTRFMENSRRDEFSATEHPSTVRHR